MLDVDIARLVSALKQSAAGLGTKMSIPEYVQWIVRAGKDSDIIAIKVADARTGYYVDIFSYYHAKDEVCFTTCPYGQHCKCRPVSWVFPVRLCEFDGMPVFCPIPSDCCRPPRTGSSGIVVFLRTISLYLCFF